MTTRPAASFRDPGGFCFALGERILRVVSPDSLAQIDGFLTSALAQKALESRFLVSTRRLADTELQPLRADGTFRTVVGQRAVGAVFEHETIPFPSYAYEWPPEMLASAGELTLDLAESALAEGFGLKDATPHNVLFRGPQPVFIDVLSFEKRVPDDPVWMADAQFQRTFLLPLLA
ncbi:MAG TPA: SAM-dependent methyltransferase, partial [Verrucomicrobiae bacterium]|nr:SAM-dependent methyltransferase [Verrucomicrobiae bacterium]